VWNADLVPFLNRKLVKRRDMLNAGIVNEDIEPAELCNGYRDHLGNRLRSRHVGW